MRLKPYRPKHARCPLYKGKHALFRPWHRARWVVTPVLILSLSKINTGEFPAVTRDAEITPPPWFLHDDREKPQRAVGFLAPPPKPKPKPRPRPQPRPRPKPVLKKKLPAQPTVIDTSFAKRQHVLMAARALLGIPYVYGGASYDGLDCSGFTMLAYRSVGLSLPHHSNSQPSYGRRVDHPLPGDLAWRYGHVAIVYGGGQLIGARHSGTVSQIYRDYGGFTYFRMV
jgi:cell wall-associated NlpC family hydrolase